MQYEAMTDPADFDSDSRRTVHSQCRRLPRRRTPGLGITCLGIICLALATPLLFAASVFAKVDGEPAAPTAKAPGVPGRLIRIPLPITGNVDDRIKGMVQRAIDRIPEGARRPTIVLELSPGQSEYGEGSKYSRAFELAQFLTSREVAKVKTVAYVPRSIKGHAVLVAMACEEIVMAPDAEIGEAGVDAPDEEAIQPAVLSGYRQIAERRHTVPVKIALGMLDKRLEVLKVKTEVSVEYVLREDLPELRKEQQILEEEVLIRPGDLGQFTGRQGRELGFVKYLAGDREALAHALDLPPEALKEDPSLGGGWEPIQISVEGNIRHALVERVKGMLGDQLRAGNVNLVVLRIDSEGGSVQDSLQLATFLAEIDASSVRTVAYVPRMAKSDAALIALACDDLIMHPGAVLGGDPLRPIPAETIQAATVTIRDKLAADKARSWSLPVAMIDPALDVFRYTNNQTGAVDYFSPDEVQAQENPDDWDRGREVTTAAGPLALEGLRAAELGLASSTVENFEELKQLYGITGDPRLVAPNWAHTLIEGMAHPSLAWILLFIGFMAIYAELQMPGIGVGGFLALVCFLLFFWSKYLMGTAGWLEVLLFLGGFCCLLMEIFVIPGFGIFGLGGGMMIIASLVLAGQTMVLPRSEHDYAELRDGLLVVGAACVAFLGASAVMRRYLPHAPMFNRLMLQPPAGDEATQLGERESMAHLDHLVGKQGVVTSRLTPGGKAEFGDQIVDVTAGSEIVDAGTPVEVVKVRGNYILVRPVKT